MREPETDETHLPEVDDYTEKAKLQTRAEALASVL